MSKQSWSVLEVGCIAGVKRLFGFGNTELDYSLVLRLTAGEGTAHVNGIGGGSSDVPYPRLHTVYPATSLSKDLVAGVAKYGFNWGYTRFGERLLPIDTETLMAYDSVSDLVLLGDFSLKPGSVVFVADQFEQGGFDITYGYIAEVTGTTINPVVVSHRYAERELVNPCHCYVLATPESIGGSDSTDLDMSNRHIYLETPEEIKQEDGETLPSAVETASLDIPVLLKLEDTDHPYYCRGSEYTEQYSSWSDFDDHYKVDTLDFESNFIVRYDFTKVDGSDLLVLDFHYVQQRRGRFVSVRVDDILPSEMGKVQAFLLEGWSIMLKMWSEVHEVASALESKE